MRTQRELLSLWVREGERLIPLLSAWCRALIQRDTDAIALAHERLQPLLSRMEPLRGALQSPIEPEVEQTELYQRAVKVAQEMDTLLQTAYEVILNELDYTHGLMAMLARTAEPEHYAPTVPTSNTTNLLMNAEV